MWTNTFDVFLGLATGDTIGDGESSSSSSEEDEDACVSIFTIT